MNREESVALFEEGRDAWNAWAQRMLKARAALEADGTWVEGRDEIAWNDATRAWHAAAAVDFSNYGHQEAADFSGYLLPGDTQFTQAIFGGCANFSKTKFLGNAEFIQAVFSDDAEFGEATFSDNACFRQVDFLNSANFKGSTFLGNAEFQQARFSGIAEFGEATFSDRAYFGQARFDLANFKTSKFSDSADFGHANLGAANFNGAAFSGGAHFIWAVFSGLSRFERTTFSGGAEFRDVTFSGNARFEGAKFLGSAWFDEATFWNDATFSQATFSGDVGFLKNNFRGAAGFQATIFSAKAWFSQATFSGNAWFTQAVFESVTAFVDARFEKATNFGAIEAKSAFSMAQATFLSVPDFIQAHFAEAPRLDDCRIEPQPSKLANFRKILEFFGKLAHVKKRVRQRFLAMTWARFKGNVAKWLAPTKWTRLRQIILRLFNGKPDRAARWRALKRLAIQGHDHAREQAFFKDELKARRWGEDKPWHAVFWFGVFYQLLSDFGRSLLRPFMWWGLSVLCFAGLYAAQHPDFVKESSSSISSAFQQLTSSGGERPPFRCVAGPGDPWVASLTLSIQKGLLVTGVVPRSKLNQLYACLYGIQPVDAGHCTLSPTIPNRITLLGFVQYPLSAVLIFLFLLAIRNHFRIK